MSVILLCFALTYGAYAAGQAYSVCTAPQRCVGRRPRSRSGKLSPEGSMCMVVAPAIVSMATILVLGCIRSLDGLGHDTHSVAVDQLGASIRTEYSQQRNHA